MKKKIIWIFIIIIILIGICLYIATNKKEKTEEPEEKDELTISLNEDGYFENPYTLNGDIKFDESCFYNVKQILRGSSNNTYLVHDNGEIWKYNILKIFTNEMNTLKLNTKIDEKIDIAFLDSKENLWFIAENKVIKVDTINDTKEEVDYMELNSVLFRGNELFLTMKQNSFYAIYELRYNENLVIQKDNQLYKYNYVSDYEGVIDDSGNKTKYNPYAEENKFETGIDLSSEEIQYFDGYFIKTSKGYYKEDVINKEEVEKYANAQEQRGYVQLKSNKYINEITYLDSKIAVANNKVYVKM